MRRARTIALLLIAFGASLRLAAARGDLWFDELWSLNRAQRVEAPLDVLLRPELQHDNNHWLNTLWMHALGPDASSLAYRAPAWLASVATLAVLAWMGWRRGPVAGRMTLLLAVPSFLLVQYGSEARGYSGAMLFSLLAFALLERDGERDGEHGGGHAARWRVPAFWAAVLLGVASHLTFLYGYAALLAWHPLRLARRGPPRSVAARLALHHALPLAVIAAVYLTTLRHVVIGGGPRFPTAEVVLESLGWLFGIRAGSPWTPLAAAAAAALVLAELALRVRARDDTALFHLVLLLVPALLLAVHEPEVLYVRYFVVCVPFVLHLFASLLARGWTRGGVARALAGLVLVATLAGNAVPLAGLLRHGRGGYGAAVRYLAEHTPGGPIEVGVTGDHNVKLLVRHAETLEPRRELVLREPGQPTPRPPDWIVAEGLDARFEPPKQLVGPFGARYVLAREFPFSGLSGMSWFVYHRGGIPP